MGEDTGSTWEERREGGRWEATREVGGRRDG